MEKRFQNPVQRPAECMVWYSTSSSNISISTKQLGELTDLQGVMSRCLDRAFERRHLDSDLSIVKRKKQRK